MATFKLTAILTFVVGVQLIDLTHTMSTVCRHILNNELRPSITVLTVAFAADLHSVTLRWNQPTFIPPLKGAPKSTQGSGTR